MFRTTMNNRRGFLASGGFSLGSIAITEMLSKSANAFASDDVTRKPHFAPKTKHVIYLHMVGAPSQLDLFDPKPELVKRHNQPCPEEVTKGRDFAFIGKTSTLAGSPWSFGAYGQSGQMISELLLNLATVADDIAVIRSVHNDEINHAPAQMFLHSGFGRGGRPSLRTWVTYGLGTENEDLSGLCRSAERASRRCGYQFVDTGISAKCPSGDSVWLEKGDPVLFLTNPAGYKPEDRRRELDALKDLNEQQLEATGDPEVATRISQYELAFRMQTSVPELMSISGGTKETLEMYGAKPGEASFANNCLLARRLVERGVRHIELYDSDWDHQRSIKTRLPAKCKDVDQAMAALIQDLKARGLLSETLIVWGSEFGQLP